MNVSILTVNIIMASPNKVKISVRKKRAIEKPFFFYTSYFLFGKKKQKPIYCVAHIYTIPIEQLSFLQFLKKR